MGVRKIYRNGNTELNMQWSPEGIHIEIKRNDSDITYEHIIEPSDFYDFEEDIEMYMEAVNDGNSNKKEQI